MKTSAHNIRILSLLLLFTLLHSISEAKQYFFQQIPSQNGLSSMVRCMEVSQEKGYVWIGTRSVNPEKPDVPLNKNDAFQKVQKRHVQEKR